jgi:D-alanyl-D-alanine carboxypeptidase
VTDGDSGSTNLPPPTSGADGPRSRPPNGRLGVLVAIFLSASAIGGVAAITTKHDSKSLTTTTDLSVVVTDPPTLARPPLTDPLSPSTEVETTTATTLREAPTTVAPTDAPVVTEAATTTTAATLATTPPDSGVESTPIPVGVGIPKINAAAYAVYDATNGKWLAGNHADAPLPVGSVMKLLTSYVVLQAGDFTKVATVPKLEIDPEESSIGLTAGETFQRDTLFRAMLIVSANDAARTLAVDIAGSVDAFTDRMNAVAQQLGLTNTVAANPIGLDAAGAHSSARDVIILGSLLMQNDMFREAVAKPTAKLHGMTFPNTNGLLATYRGADGIKTGHTTDAAYCLVGSATRDGRRIIVAVLGSPSEDERVLATAALLDWGFAQPV